MPPVLTPPVASTELLALVTIGVSGFLSLVATAAMLWKTSRDQVHTLRVLQLQHEFDAADRLAKATAGKLERELSASSVRERLATEGALIQGRLADTAAQLRDRVDASAQEQRVYDIAQQASTKQAFDDQTVTLMEAIDKAKAFTADKADAAYHEANSVNVKLEKLHLAHTEQGRVLQQLLESLELNAKGKA